MGQALEEVTNAMARQSLSPRVNETIPDPAQDLFLGTPQHQELVSCRVSVLTDHQQSREGHETSNQLEKTVISNGQHRVCLIDLFVLITLNSAESDILRYHYYSVNLLNLLLFFMWEKESNKFLTYGWPVPWRNRQTACTVELIAVRLLTSPLS